MDPDAWLGAEMLCTELYEDFPVVFRRVTPPRVLPRQQRCSIHRSTSQTTHRDSKLQSYRQLSPQSNGPSDRVDFMCGKSYFNGHIKDRKIGRSPNEKRSGNQPMAASTLVSADGHVMNWTGM